MKSTVHCGMSGGDHEYAGFRGRVSGAARRGRSRRASGQGDAARLAGGEPAAQRPRTLRRGGALPASLVRRTGDAAPLHHRRREGLLRQQVPRHRRPPRRRVGDDRLPRVRDRPVPLTVRPLLHPLRAQAHPERERQHHPLRRPLRGADRDADTGRLRPGHARDRGSGGLRGRVERPADHGPPAPGPHHRRPGQLPAALLAHQRVPPLPAEGHGRGPRADRQPPDRPPLLHAQLRHHGPATRSSQSSRSW